MSLSNDMISLRKEIKHGDIDSIIPVLVFNRDISIQKAIEVRCLPPVSYRRTSNRNVLGKLQRTSEEHSAL